jgi:hypothetical protein
MDIIPICSMRFRYMAGNLLLLASTAGLFVFTSEVTLRASLTGLYYSSIPGNFSPLTLISGLCIVICYMSLEQVSAVG